MSTSAIFVVLQHSIHGVPLFLVTAGCILLLMRARSGAALVMLIGNLLLIAVAALQGVLTLMMIGGTMNHEAYGRLAIVIQIASLCGGVTFGVGFLIMAFAAQQKMPGKSPPPPLAGAASPSE